MADTFTKFKRSQIMAAVRSSKNKSTELRLIALFRQVRITGWRRHFKLIGSPDFVFPKHKLAIFVDGCFWHSCPKHRTRPATNRPFWDAKLRRNRARDRKVIRHLRAKDWRVVRIWEHDLKITKIHLVAARIRRILQQP